MIADGMLVPIVAIACAPLIAIGVPIARAVARRIEAGAGQPRMPADVTDRLQRMEEAIDSIAVEVERISESQRFAARLLAEPGGRASDAALPGAPPGRARTLEGTHVGG